MRSPCVPLIRKSTSGVFAALAALGLASAAGAAPTRDETAALQRVNDAVAKTLASNTGITKVIWNLIQEGKATYRNGNLSTNRRFKKEDVEAFDQASATISYLRCNKESDLYKALTTAEKAQYEKNCPSDFVKMAAHSSITKTGNCGEHAEYLQIGLHIMRSYLAVKGKKVFSKIEQGYFVPGDHVFVVLAFADKTSVAVVDSWAGKTVIKTQKEYAAAEGPTGKGFYQTHVVPTFKPNPYVSAASRIKIISTLPGHFDPKKKEHIVAYNEAFNLLTKVELSALLAKMK